MQVVSVDPGAVHVGVAFWSDLHGLWACQGAVEMTYDEYVDDVMGDMMHGERPPDKVCIEGFWLKPGKAALQQAGSSLETVELIGLTKGICKYQGVECIKVQNGQGAIITRLNAAGYEWASKGNGNHAKDAEAVAVRGLGLSVTQIESCTRNMKRS